MLKPGWLAKQLREEKRTSKDKADVVRRLQDLYVQESTTQVIVERQLSAPASASGKGRKLAHPMKKK